MSRARILTAGLTATALLGACLHERPDGIAPATEASVVVVHDFAYRPLPLIPLPNDVATRYDETSPTGLRINASMVAPTAFEQEVRTLVDTLDGWGVYTPISVPFSGAIDLQNVIARHHGDDYATADDVIYVVDVTTSSPSFGEVVHLDVGQGNFPQTLEQVAGYWEGDARGDTISLLFEEYDEDLDGDGVLDPGEDTDLDGLLDRANYLPHVTTRREDMTLSERARAVMTFYELETNTLLVRPLRPLRQRTTYAVIVTKRLVDPQGDPVGSPYAGVNHDFHTHALSPLAGILGDDEAGHFGGLGIGDVAFAWTFTTGTMEEDLRVARLGLYGHGPQAHLAEEFPPVLDHISELWSGEPARHHESAYTVSGETFAAIIPLAAEAGFVDNEGQTGALLQESLQYVDFHVLGTFPSPQLFERYDEEGRLLGWNDMRWPPDISTTPAPARSESVTFWLSVPRKEVSARGDGEPAPLVILGHGYTGSKTELIAFHGFFARRGIAVLCMDSVSHGVTVSAEERAALEQITGFMGLTPFVDALLTNRALDHDADGRADSGADFWTAYTFHTRDVVRQTALDYMQLVRLLRAWDGDRLWDFDTNENGDLSDDVAGDFDGDGMVDVGGAATLTMAGASLGGIMSAVVAGIEPQLDAAIPIAGGAGLADVGIRSVQGGVRESVQLRVMGPLYIGFPEEDGSSRIDAVVSDLNNTARLTLARVPSDVVLSPGDSVLLENLSNGEYDCALVQDDGRYRVSVASDIDLEEPQRHRIRFWHGNVFDSSWRDPERHRACRLLDDAGEAIHEVSHFGEDVYHYYEGLPLVFRTGDPLSPVAEGLGLHRARPALRRFLAFAQMVLDPADPATYAQHYHSGELRYPETGEVVSTSVIVLNTVGDMNVPVSTGANIGRAAGFIDHTTPIPEWGGRTVAQALIDTGVLEAVDNVKHFVDPAGHGVLWDPEDLSRTVDATADLFDWTLPEVGGVLSFAEDFPTGPDGFSVPRLNPPLHTHAIFDDPAGGKSGTFFPFIKPTGQHGPNFPGEQTDNLIAQCVEGGGDPATCEAGTYFDNGSLLFEMLGRYMVSGGVDLTYDTCMYDWSCDDDVPPPAAR